MADDLFDGILGGEEDKSEAAGAETPAAGAEAFAAAIAAIASRQDPGVARKTEIFLDHQTELLKLQAQHLRDEHASRLRHLHLSVAAAKRKRYADRMRNALYTCIALIALGVLIAAVRMTVEAITDHGLVVEGFTVPADFAARGVTSQALAEDLASRVAAITAGVNRISLTQSGEVHAEQAGVLKVQIPETGISIDELERFLHGWLGHQTLVNGELREEAGGAISLVLYIAGADPIVVSGSSADLNRLVQTAAEKALAILSPRNYALYLAGTGRGAEGEEALERWAHLPSMSSRDRADAYSTLGEGSSDPHRALSEALLATHIDPGEANGWRIAAEASEILGHDEAAVGFYRKEIGTKRQDQPANQQRAYPILINGARMRIDRYMGDFEALQREFLKRENFDLEGLAANYATGAQLAAVLHDEGDAREDLAYALAAWSPDEGPRSSDTVSPVEEAEARWGISSAAGDWAQALDAAKALIAAREALKSIGQKPVFVQGMLGPVLDPQFGPLLAYAEAMTGDTASAAALISQTPTDCYLCVRTRAKVAAAAGDAATADRWFAAAVRQAPDLPMAYFEWGQALLARGDLAGAAQELSLAHEKGPRFADPLKVWGDVLVKQGRSKEALAKYDEALKYAPNWEALKAARAAEASKRT